MKHCNSKLFQKVFRQRRAKPGELLGNGIEPIGNWWKAKTIKKDPHGQHVEEAMDQLFNH